MPEKLATAEKAELDQFRMAASDFLQGSRFAEAEAVCEKMVRDFPKEPDGWVFHARIAQRQNNFYGAAAHTRRALDIAPGRLDVHLVAAESQIYIGRIAEAIAALNCIKKDAHADDAAFRQLSALYTQLGRHQDAYYCAQRARDLSPHSLNRLYLVASAAIAVGKMKEAEKLLDEIIKAAPDEGDIYYNRSTLRKQTANDNHVDELRRRLNKLRQGDHREAPVCYALGKELEDLGEHQDAFHAFVRGAKSRRARLAYDVGMDEQAADDIIETFNVAWAHKTPDGAENEGPIFVLGLPRSGTTLVDRILSAHSKVTSLGEVNDFAYAVVRTGYPAVNKQDLIRRTANADLRELGEAYWDALCGYGEAGAYFIDKTPANYLYLGLIAKALPNARIVHVRRHPMASGYAMYKTLFRMGYPFSYDFKDIGRYYLAYDRLMTHWKNMFPGRILDVQYEALVDDQEAVSRTILAHCRLHWEEECIEFHRSAAPTATASAAQVRQPIYREARDLWRTHETALAPLAKVLKEGGMECQ
ncbi:MAG: tetratricopeptide repeat protein [Alphaproteobacteria bacterium]|nr:tetratricopeptide repeat protein [Alphaproteobacteria bacterium]